MKNLSHSLTLLMVFFTMTALGQPGWNWGTDVDIAKEKNAFYSDMVKAGRYQEAIPSHEWLLANTPDLNESLYQNGAKIYESLVDTEKDPVKIAQYKSKAMDMYDLRIKYFGKEDFVLNRKVYPAYKFYKDDKTKYKELYEMFTRAFELNKNEFNSSNLVAYMDVVRRYKAVKGDISDEKVIDIYSQVMDVVEFQRSSGKNLATLDKIADNIDKLLTSTIDLNCDFVESILGPKLAGSTDVKLAKKVFQLMLTGKCSDRPLAFDAAQIINKSEPSFGIAKFLAIRAIQNGDKVTALKYYEEAISLTDENSSKAEIYMSIAKINASNGEKSEARTNARKAIAFDPSLKDAYSLIGDLYMTSFDECKAGVKKTYDYAVFIAAYKMYERAGDSAGMSKSKALFPSIEDIFSEGFEEGQNYQVGCWINESVKIERRPSE